MNDNLIFKENFKLEDVKSLILNMDEPIELPYIIKGEIFQFESRNYKGFEKGKRYIPMNIHELSIQKPKAIDLNSKITIDNEINLSEINKFIKDLIYGKYNTTIYKYTLTSLVLYLYRGDNI